MSVQSPHGSTPQPLAFRAATTSDAERLAHAVVEGLEEDAGPNLALVEYRRALGDRALRRQAPEQRARQMP